MRIINGSDLNTSVHSSSSKRSRIGYFSRPELTRILGVYAMRVAQGEGRDYSLDHLDGQAFFSIYRSSHEMPLYTIEKRRLKGKDRWLFSLRDRKKTLKSGARLQDILDYLSGLPRLVSS